MMAILILSGVILYKKFTIRLKPRAIISILLTGIVTSIYWALLAFSAKTANASVTLVGLATSPLWVSFIQTFFTNQSVGFYKIVTGLNAIFGVYMIFSSDFDYINGMYYAISAAFFGALATVLNSFLAKSHNNIVITFYQMVGAWIGTAIFLVIYSFAFPTERLDITPSLMDLVLIFALAFVFSVYAYSLLIKIMKVLSPFTVALATNLSPIYGIILAIVFFGHKELMNIYFYAGSVIIIASVMAAPLAEYLFKEKEKTA
jgi:drug/metabolite transporter (DMT)-like permease